GGERLAQAVGGRVRVAVHSLERAASRLDGPRARPERVCGGRELHRVGDAEPARGLFDGFTGLIDPSRLEGVAHTAGARSLLGFHLCTHGDHDAHGRADRLRKSPVSARTLGAQSHRAAPPHGSSGKQPRIFRYLVFRLTPSSASTTGRSVMWPLTST